jgi:hypothetical protein
VISWLRDRGSTIEIKASNERLPNISSLLDPKFLGIQRKETGAVHVELPRMSFPT